MNKNLNNIFYTSVKKPIPLNNDFIVMSKDEIEYYGREVIYQFMNACFERQLWSKELSELADELYGE
jgi:hypothetical protein